ncbi:FG-GAP repeat domain-containing protein [Gilvibacter sediminis]|uniref:FG-GAP repeat domain-containing protein n=1 Tax=Gilvibacter sediminis TaxID=379071 RepID=UPI0023506B4E|nr:VCBS repeat-containing protein [Gilvibacter sediminis]MDC7997256.1 VCBS repeat-containing protein [Gilvibacter sediminis]
MTAKLSLLLLCVCLSISCKQDPSYSEAKKEGSVKSATENGQKYATLYCTSCHAFPEPTLLDRDTWKNYMLPRMAAMFGRYDSVLTRASFFEQGAGGERLRASGLFPDRQTMPDSVWNDIAAYYLNYAPDTLSYPKPKQLTLGQLPFEVKRPELKVQIPSTTLAHFNKSGSIYIGDANTRSFSVFSADLELKQTATIQEGLVWIRETPEDYWMTSMGQFAPTDAALGSIIRIPKQGRQAVQPVKNLQRPVHTDYADLNGDGVDDMVISEFGKWTGQLTFHLSTGANGYVRRVLHPEPGAIKAYFRDMNADGHLDIVALFAQGNEGVDIFYNDGKANFTRERVLQFSPSMGSSFMNLIDYNADGHLDILLTAGDNADYKPLMKPWHGVYVFLNKGDNSFKQEVFEHLNGAYNAVVADFDMDGDQDIAAIAFFPDWANSPQESFVYFEQNENVFEPHGLEVANSGRWVVMDAADYDRDGDLDLVMGSLAFEVVPKLGFVQRWMQEGLPFMLLKNTSR